MNPDRASRTVVVLGGGKSAEREVSLVSAREVIRACIHLGYRTVMIDPALPDLTAKLLDAQPQCVFNALHGPYGEDGRIQGLLETFGINYTHSGVLASALAMDKPRARYLFAANGLDIPNGFTTERYKAAQSHIMPPPYVVKPLDQGSSYGVIIVDSNNTKPPEQLLEPNWQHGNHILIEEFIPGTELTVCVMGNKPLAVTEIRFLTKYYDYTAKYTQGGSSHILPANVPDAIRKKAMQMASSAHQILGCKGVTRSDLRYDSDSGRLVILETNTQPGMTPGSLVPEQAAHCGVSFEELVEWIVNDASCPR